MKENETLLNPLLPAPGSKRFLVVEQLTFADILEHNDAPNPYGVVRVSLCDNRQHENKVPVYELLLEADEATEVKEAFAKASLWASGFMLGARYVGCDLGLTIQAPKTPTMIIKPYRE